MIIAVTNLKGGVGKTTLSTNLAVGLAHAGLDVCVVDTDTKQQSAIEWKSNRDQNLPAIAVVRVSEKQLIPETEQLSKRYDVVIIDGVPQLSELVEDMVLAADVVLIPVTPSVYDYRGFELFHERFSQIKRLKEKNGRRTEGFVIMNRVGNNHLGKDVEDAVSAYDIGLFKTRIGNRVAYADTANEGLGVIEYKDAKAREEMLALTGEIAEVLRSFK